MPMYTCSKCGKESTSNSNMHKHVRTVRCRGATINVTNRARVYKGYARRRERQEEQQEAKHHHTEATGGGGGGCNVLDGLLDALAEECQGSFALLPATIFRRLGRPTASSSTETPETFCKLFLQESIDLVSDALTRHDQAALNGMVLEKTYEIAGRKYSVADAVRMYVAGSANFHVVLPRSLRSVVIEAKKTLKKCCLAAV